MSAREVERDGVDVREVEMVSMREVGVHSDYDLESPESC